MWKKRLVCLLSGCVLVAINIWAIQHGKLGGISERYRQPVFVSGIGAVGIVLIAAGLAPTRLILKMTALRKYRPFGLRSRTSTQAAAGLTKPANPK
jgi:hypothetical protein